ncbi:MAG: aldo/keto reductase, partial [Pseudomonadota bacterium]
GITCFDCADIYTGVEELIGAFLARLAKERGAEARAQVKVHTKYVPDIASLATLQPADVAAVIDRSLLRLGVDRLDLVQFHWWDYAMPGWLEAAGHLADLARAGKIDRIGLTNFDLAHSRGIVAAGVPVISTQIQYSLLDRRAAGAFADWARDNGVAILAYGGLAGGFLSDAWLGRPDPGFRFENRSLVKYRLIIEEFGGWAAFQALLETLRSVADRHGVDISAIVLRAMLDTDDISGVILGARYAHRLPATLSALTVELSAEDHAQIAALQAAAPGPSGDVFGLERDRTGRHGAIMKYNLNSGDTATMGG